jgi:hypothetical protein
MASYFEKYGPVDSITISLGVADFQLTSSDPSIYGQIDLTKSGWETAGTSSSFEDNFGWWLTGLATGTLGDFLGIPYLDDVVGLIPVMETRPVTPQLPPQLFGQLNQNLYANGTSIDPNGHNWGTVSMYFQVYFPLPAVNAPPIVYTFNLAMETWLQESWGGLIPGTISRFSGMPFNTQLQFSVFG